VIPVIQEGGSKKSTKGKVMISYKPKVTTRYNIDFYPLLVLSDPSCHILTLQTIGYHYNIY